MVRLQDCPPCQTGDHDHHYEIVQAVPDGVLGGVRCMCHGECRDNAAERREGFLNRMGITPAVREAMARVARSRDA